MTLVSWLFPIVFWLMMTYLKVLYPEGDFVCRIMVSTTLALLVSILTIGKGLKCRK